MKDTPLLSAVGQGGAGAPIFITVGEMTVKLSHFYGLAVDRQEYCFTKKNIFYFLLFYFLKFIFEPKPLFFQIRIENSLGVHPLSFLKKMLVSE